MQLFDPAWVKKLGELPLNSDQKDALEKLRKEYSVPHDVFAIMVLDSPGATRITLQKLEKLVRRDYPRATDKQILRGVLFLRDQASNPVYIQRLLSTESDRTRRAMLEATSKQVMEGRMATADDDVRLDTINSLDDLVKFELEDEDLNVGHVQDPYDVADQINTILSR